MSKYKRIFCLVLFVSFSVLLTGCFRIRADITVKRNGKADVSLLYAAQADLANLAESEESPFGMTPEELEEYRAEGWTVTDYSEDGYTGYIISRKDADLSQTSLSDDMNGSIRKEGSLYIVDYTPLSEESQQDISSYASFVRAAGGFVSVRVTLPVKPVNHNAQKVSEDGKTLEWDILAMKPGDTIHAEVRIPNVALWAGIALLIAAAAGFLIYRSRSAKKTDIAEETAEEIPVTAEETETPPADVLSEDPQPEPPGDTEESL